jgi:hypothetical protein
MTKSVSLSLLLLLALSSATSRSLAADDWRCSGHKLFPAPRPESSCMRLKLEILASPDKTAHAVVYPSDVSLNTTPDMESRVVIRSSTGETLASQDYSSSRGMNGHYVYLAKWSPDSNYFVFSMTSSGGHSPWSFPIWAYGRKENQFVRLSDMMNGAPTLSGDFQFSGPHIVDASTWKEPGAIDEKVPVSVDLEEGFKKSTPSPK